MASLLTTFHAVAAHASMADAAARLGLPNRVVSQQMTRLERLIGTPLFARQLHQLELTKTGDALFDQISAQVTELQSEAAGAVGPIETKGAKGLATLTVTLNVWGVAHALRRFSGVFRALPYQVDFISEDPGKGDVCVYLAKEPRPNWVSEPLFECDIIAVAAQDYPAPRGNVTRGDFAQHPLLSLGHPQHENDWADYLALAPKESLPCIPRDPYPSFSHYIRAIEAGRGLGIGMAALFQNALQRRSLKRVGQHPFKRDEKCFASLRPGCDRDGPALEVIHLLRDIFVRS